MKILWKEVSERLSCGHGVQFHHAQIGGMRMGPPVAFLEGYGWKRGRSEKVKVFLLAPDSRLFSETRVNGARIKKEAKEAVELFLEKFFEKKKLPRNESSFGDLTIWYNT